jgi:hypothetical protein
VPVCIRLLSTPTKRLRNDAHDLPMGVAVNEPAPKGPKEKRSFFRERILILDNSVLYPEYFPYKSLELKDFGAVSHLTRSFHKSGGSKGELMKTKVITALMLFSAVLATAQDPAKLFCYRNGGLFGKSTSALVFVDKQLLCNLHSGRYCFIAVAPGEHLLVAYSSAGTTAQHIFPIFEAGESYYFEVETDKATNWLRFGLAGSIWKFTPRTETEARIDKKKPN